MPTHASLFTGAYPSEHGTDRGIKYLNPSYTTVTERLNEAGYQTVYMGRQGQAEEFVEEVIRRREAEATAGADRNEQAADRNQYKYIRRRNPEEKTCTEVGGELYDYLRGPNESAELKD